MKNETPSKRLEVFLNLQGIDFNDFCRLAGIKTGNADKYVGESDSKKRKSTFKQDKRANFEKAGLNYNWYLTGQGEMLLSDELSKPMQITKVLPTEIKQALTKEPAYTLSELLNPQKLLQNKPDLDFYVPEALKDLTLEEIEILKNKNIAIVNRLFENVIALRNEYERNQENKTDKDTPPN